MARTYKDLDKTWLLQLAYVRKKEYFDKVEGDSTVIRSLTCSMLLHIASTPTLDSLTHQDTY